MRANGYLHVYVDSNIHVHYHTWAPYVDMAANILSSQGRAVLRQTSAVKYVKNKENSNFVDHFVWQKIS
jgi:hypothetical protein